MFFVCKRCSSYVRGPAHKCFEYTVKINHQQVSLYANYPEDAVEKISKTLNKEIYCSIGDIEYVTEKIDDRFVASIIFEGNNVKRIK